MVTVVRGGRVPVSAKNDSLQGTLSLMTNKFTKQLNPFTQSNVL